MDGILVGFSIGLGTVLHSILEHFWGHVSLKVECRSEGVQVDGVPRGRFPSFVWDKVVYLLI